MLPGALLLLALALPVSAQDRVVLRGYIVDAEGSERVAGAQVMSPLSERVALTDTLGAFEIPFIADSEYELMATAIGYHTVRVRLGPEAEERLIAIELPRDEQMAGPLATLAERIEERRRLRRTRRLEVVESPTLAASTAETAYDMLKELTSAQPCRGLRSLCRLGREVGLCVDDAPLNGGARDLEALDPADLWLVELYNEGRDIRIYTRWFIDNTLRTREGRLRRNPIC